MTRSVADAEDIVQDTYVHAWRALGGLKDDVAGLAWLCRIARNTAIDHGRRRARRPTDSLDDVRDGARALSERLAHPDDAPDVQVEAASTRAFVLACIDALPDKFRVPLLLADVDGLSHDAIAVVLGVAVGTVDSRLNRARSKLHQKIRAQMARTAPASRTP
jgi:RNA polymerase sigma-70 factor (ECF subfamily)